MRTHNSIDSTISYIKCRTEMHTEVPEENMKICNRKREKKIKKIKIKRKLKG